MKKFTSVLLLGIFTLSLALSSCGNSNDNNTEPTISPVVEEDNNDDDDNSSSSDTYVVSEPLPEPDTASNERIEMLIQDHSNGFVAEIPYFAYDGKHSEIDAVNKVIKDSLVRMYDKYAEINNGIHTVEIRSYTQTSERYLQFITTSCILPSYLPSGAIDSFCYDILNKKIISVEEKVAENGFTAEDIQQKTNELFTPDDPTDKIIQIVVNGFLIKETPDSGEILTFILETDMAKEDEYLGKFYYGLIPDTNTLFKINEADLNASFKN